METSQRPGNRATPKREPKMQSASRHASRSCEFRRWFRVGVSILAVASVFGGSWFALANEAADGKISGEGSTEAIKPEFDHKVAPVITRNCLHCHNGSQAEGNLDLSTREGMLKGGDAGPAIEPNDADASYLISRVRDHEMPPEGKGKPLSDDDIAALTTWVNSGATWPEGRTLSEFDFTTDRRAGRDWWSLTPPVRPALPDNSLSAPLSTAMASAEQNAIDRFIRAELAAKQLAPSPEAARAILIRRAYFDLTGLPPSPEEIAEFAVDESPDAFERLVDRLLASPRYGERWARHWLDVARFGESSGYEVNTPRDNAWPYRDYVIQSLNDDKPYNRFVQEQIAGDQLGAGIATSFLVAGPKDLVGINNIEGQRQQRLDDLDDIVGTTATAFLGLTVSCAKCHNHKFDPISQTDYFRLAAVFSGVSHGDRMVESLDYERRAKLVAPLLARKKAIDERLAQLDQQIDAIGERIAVIPSTTATPEPVDLTKLRAAVNSQRNVDRFQSIAARFVRFTIESANASEPCIDELEIFTAESAPQNVALASSGAKATASGVYANGSSPIHQLAHVNDGQYGNSNSWISSENGRGWVQIELAELATIDRVVWGRDRELKFRDRTATKYRIDVAAEPGQWITVATHLDRAAFDPSSQLAGRDINRLPSELADEYRRLDTERTALTKSLPAPTMSVFAGSFASMPAPTQRLNRGDVMQPREEVAPGGIVAAGPAFELPSSTSDAERRRKFAEWVIDPKHPLTARVIVNRLWHYHFGQGLMLSPSNFGFLGGKPSHPALLDWLATEIVDREWSLKAMHRMMLTSATWRQSSAQREDGLTADAQSRLLWRYPPQRLEAEPIRDSILAISGTLDLRMGGPGYSVFEPNDNYVRVYNPKKNYGPAEWRRMVYQMKPRMRHDGTFGIFDCPDASAPMAKRNTSTTALQALSLFNSEFILQQAEYFAKRLRSEAGDAPEAQVRRAFELAFGRPPEAEETAAAVQLVQEHGLESVCRAMLNASELVFVN
jgi:hypothetical protein